MIGVTSLYPRPCRPRGGFNTTNRNEVRPFEISFRATVREPGAKVRYRFALLVLPQAAYIHPRARRTNQCAAKYTKSPVASRITWSAIFANYPPSRKNPSVPVSAP